MVVLLAIATLFAGNHCLLGGMKIAAAGKHSCCSPSAKSEPATEYSACCASLAAPIPGHAIAPESPLSMLTPAWLAAVSGIFSEIEPGAAALLPPTHAPPGPSFFCELVLSRSLPAHAPPSSFA